MIVVLAGPSLAERVARQGQLSPRAQRRFVKRAQAFQRRLLSALRVQGVKIKPLFAYTRTFNGFSAVLDGRDIAALERAPGVVGIYPVRTVYPASVSEVALGSSAADAGWRSRLGVPGSDGSGVTVALLDTGVDSSHPALAGRVEPGVDLVDGDSRAAPRESPETGRLETHGTRMAAIVAGAPGPGGAAGVATGASILPIRVLGWLRAENGAFAVLGRSDTVLAGLERARRSEPERRRDRRGARRARRDRRAVRLVWRQPRGARGRRSAIARDAGRCGRRKRRSGGNGLRDDQRPRRSARCPDRRCGRHPASGSLSSRRRDGRWHDGLLRHGQIAGGGGTRNGRRPPWRHADRADALGSRTRGRGDRGRQRAGRFPRHLRSELRPR